MATVLLADKIADKIKTFSFFRPRWTKLWRGKNLPNQGGGVAKGVKTNVIDEKRLQHIFRKKLGHLKDTPANRKLLERVANDPKCKLGPDKHGNIDYGFIRKDGKQIWIRVRDGKIINGGINNVPKVYNPETGLFAPQRPQQKK